MARAFYSFIKKNLSVTGSGDNAIFAITVPSTSPFIVLHSAKLMFNGVKSDDQPVNVDLIKPHSVGTYSGTLETAGVRLKNTALTYTRKSEFRLSGQFTAGARGANDEYVGAWDIHPQGGVIEFAQFAQEAILVPNTTYEMVINKSTGNDLVVTVWMDFEE